LDGVPYRKYVKKGQTNGEDRKCETKEGKNKTAQSSNIEAGGKKFVRTVECHHLEKRKRGNDEARLGGTTTAPW